MLAIGLLIPYHSARFLQKGLGESDILNSGVWFLHAWHMPLFFALSGYLAGAALLKSDALTQIRGRLSRLGLPLIVGMLTVVPLANLAVIEASTLRARRGPIPDDRTLTWGNVFNLTPRHLWFLAYLLAITLLVLGASIILRKFHRYVPEWPSRFMDWFLDSPLAIVELALIGAGILMLRDAWAMGNGSNDLVPDPVLLVYLGLFFSFGWHMSSRPWLTRRVSQGPWLHTALAVGIGIPASILFYNHTDFTGGVGTNGTLAQNPDLRYAALVAGSLVAWSALYGIWGLSARYANRESRVIRYLADASFWVFLVHIPALVAIQSSLAETNLSALLRYVITVVGTLAVALGTYTVFVRRSPLGKFLHGPRPRGKRAVVPIPSG